MMGYESVHIEFPRHGERKVIIDGKELDISKIKSIRIDADCNGIDVDVELGWRSLPYKN